MDHNGRRRASAFLKAPRTFEWLSPPLLTGSQPNLDRLRQAIIAEYILITGEFPVGNFDPSAEFTTALGDFSFRRQRRSFHDRYIGEIFVCTSGEHSLFNYALGSAEPRRYSQDDAANAVKELDVALTTLRSAKIVAYDLVNAMLQTIVLHRCLSDERVVSGSRISTIGLAALTNVDSNPVLCIIDALVHEAVHTCLYRIELLEPFYLIPRNDESVQIESPWSGRSLPVHSYVHACFVWFALTNLWAQWPVQSERQQALYLHARSGFAKLCLAEPLGGKVTSAVIQAITEVQSFVQEALPC
jgi:hypothetical protein